MMVETGKACLALGWEFLYVYSILHILLCYNWHAMKGGIMLMLYLRGDMNAIYMPRFVQRFERQPKIRQLHRSLSSALSFIASRFSYYCRPFIYFGSNITHYFFKGKMTRPR
jgi:hypothetical protein